MLAYVKGFSSLFHFSRFSSSVCIFHTVMSYDGHYYWVVSGQSTYSAALDRAGQMTYRGLTGHLATVTTPGEYNFLYWTMNVRGALIALSDAMLESQWRFTAGPELGKRATADNFTLWSDGEPNGGAGEHCVIMSISGYNDVACGNQLHTYVVEFECPVIASPPGRCQSKLSASWSLIVQLATVSFSFAAVDSCNSTTCVCITGYLTDDGLCALEPGPCQLPDTYESQPSTVSTRRVCINVTTCTATQFQVAAPTNTTDRVCKNWTACTDTQFEISTPTNTSDRVCTDLTTCTPTQYQTVAPTTTRDRVCDPLTVCTSIQHQTTPPTATSDRVCTGSMMICFFPPTVSLTFAHSCRRGARV
jgi:hypothetical protein